MRILTWRCWLSLDLQNSFFNNLHSLYSIEIGHNFGTLPIEVKIHSHIGRKHYEFMGKMSFRIEFQVQRTGFWYCDSTVIRNLANPSMQTNNILLWQILRFYLQETRQNILVVYQSGLQFSYAEMTSSRCYESE